MERSISAEELDKYLKTITNKLLENNPALKNQDGLIDKVVDETTRILRFKEQKSKSAITKTKILDPEFIRQLSQTIVTTAVLHGSEEQQQFMAALEEALSHLKAKNAYHNELHSVLQEQEALLNDLQELLKDLTELTNLDPVLLDKIQEKLHKKLQKRMHKKLLKKLEKLLSLKLNPNNKESLRDALRKLMNEIKANIDLLKKNPTLDKTLRPIREDVYINLFGLLNSYIAGSIAVPLTQYIGNGLGFNDWNPFHGYANIDKINEISFLFQDPLGMEAQTLQNFFAMDDEEVNTLTDLLRAEGLAPEHAAQFATPFDLKKSPPR